MVGPLTDPLRVSLERDVKTPLEILLVEEDAAYAARLGVAIRQSAGDASIVITTVGRLSAAVEHARSRTWDAVVLSLSLPDSHGLASLLTMSAAAPHLPVVVLTSADDEAAEVASLRQGAQECLVRNADTGLSLYRVIQHAIARHAYMEPFRTAESRYRSLAESAVQGIVLHVDGIVRFANPAFADLVGTPSADEIVGRPLWPHIAEQDRSLAMPRWLSRSGLQAKPSRFALRIVRTDKAVRWVECSVSDVAWEGERMVMAAVVDITELNSAIERLRASDERFRLIADNTREAFVILELPSGRPLYLSRMWEEISGRPVSDADATPKLLFDAVEPENRGAVAAAFEAARRGEAAESIFRLRRPEGSLRWVRARTFPVRDDRGHVHRMVGLVEDITQLRQTEEQLRQAQKMDAIGQLAGGIAHDFNNLLVVIGGYAELVCDALGPAHPLRHDVDAIRAAAQSAEGLTRQLLAVSRRQILQPQVLDLNHALQRVQQLLRRVIGEDIDLVMNLANPLRRVCADPGQIEQVILNLAVNARDAMPNGGRLTIETADVDLDAAYVAQHQDATAGPHVMIGVSDTGCGMDETTLKRLFEPFFTTKPPGRGTGLGLATVYGIVNQSQGSIWVYSEPGRGAIFKILLPAASSPLDVLSHSELDVQALRGDETVLVLEDQAEVRGVIVDTLRRHGYTVAAARTSAEAMAMARDRHRRLDLLVTDLVLPDVNGWELAGRIVAERPGTLVLYMSGYTDTSGVHNAVLEEAAVFMQKPFSAGTLLRNVRAVLDGPSREAYG
jgi:two-component system cell cycle sensor histidine kinase/response regulator CckA